MLDAGDCSEAFPSPLQQVELPGLWPKEGPPFEGPFIPHIPAALRYAHAESLARDAAARAARAGQSRLVTPLEENPPQVP